MKIEKIWAMPNGQTFKIKPIRELLEKYIVGDMEIVDPFAGRWGNSPGTITNDLDTEAPTTHHMCALEFCKSLETGIADVFLYDPPYSISQATQLYKGFGASYHRPHMMDYWAKIKTEAERILKPDGIAICMDWSAMGLGKNRGFEMIELLVVPHGGSKNATLVTVEKKGDKQ